MEADTYNINMSGIKVESKSTFESRYRRNVRIGNYPTGWSEISK
jgi:hypothetical protein